MSAKLTVTKGIRERIKTAKLMKAPSLGADAFPTKKTDAASGFRALVQRFERCIAGSAKRIFSDGMLREQR